MLAWTPADLPPSSRYAKLSSGRTRYEVAGPEGGRPVLLVHGLSYPLEVWSPLFWHLAEAGHRVCRYDLPGRGLSSYDGRPLSSEALARHLLELMDAARLEAPVDLVSLSNADLVTLEAALVAPERVRSLVWLAPSGLDSRTRNWKTDLLRKLPVLHSQAERLLRDRCARRIEGHFAHLGPDATPATRHAYGFALRSVREGPAFAAAALSQLLHSPAPRALSLRAAALGRSETPVTAVQFRLERDTDERGVKVLLNPLPQCRRVELGGTHMGLLEAPAAVNACVTLALRDTRRSLRTDTSHREP